LARKQGLYDVSLSWTKCWLFHTGVQARKICKNKRTSKTDLEMRGKLRTGINLINSTNLENCPSQHRAEIFCFKGEYFQKMNNGTYANEIKMSDLVS